MKIASKSSYKKIEQEGLAYPKLITEKCIGCGLCAKVCFASVWEMRNKIPVRSQVQGSFCFQCGHCVSLCPQGALMDPLTGAELSKVPGKKDLPRPEILQNLFLSRRTVRIYKPEPLPRSVLERILEAGRYAPTGGNRQDVHYIVMTSREEIQKLSKMVLSYSINMFSILEHKPMAMAATMLMGKETVDIPVNYLPVLRRFKKMQAEGLDRLFYDPPALMLVHTNKWDEVAGFGCVAALYQCALMAHTLGVGSCFNGFLQIAATRDRKTKKFLGIPARHKCLGAMSLGYSNMNFKRLVSRQPAKVVWR